MISFGKVCTSFEILPAFIFRGFLFLDIYSYDLEIV